MMTGKIETTKAIYMVHGTDHFTQTANKVEFTGRKTWRALQMALKKDSFDFAAVVLTSSKDGEYAMKFSNFDHGRIAPLDQIELWYFWA